MNREVQKAIPGGAITLGDFEISRWLIAHEEKLLPSKKQREIFRRLQRRQKQQRQQ